MAWFVFSEEADHNSETGRNKVMAYEDKEKIEFKDVLFMIKLLAVIALTIAIIHWLS